MPRVSKTVVEYVVQGHYGYGWEDVYTAETYKEGKSILIDYVKNETGYPHRMIKRRVPKE